MRKPFHSRFLPLYIATLLLVFHTSVVIFINSSFLEHFVGTAGVGTVYTIGSAVSILVFLFISRVLHAVGNYRLTMSLLVINLIAVMGMAFADSLRVAVPLFIVSTIAVTLIFFNLDVFMEKQIGEGENGTGSKRGLLLALASLIGAVSPLISTSLVIESTESFTYPYLVSALTLIPVIGIIAFYFKDFEDPKYNEIKVFDAIRSFWINLNLRATLICQFSLQLFFMFMVVYSPLYLVDVIGLSWHEFGIVMFFAQLAYVILEFPIGYVADKYIGEKEMMAFGFLILIVSTSWIAFVTVPSVLVWSVLLFTTRVGASFAEATMESYFFKQIKGSDAQIISFYRVTRPVAYVFGALAASLALLYIPFNLLFVVAAILLLPALFLTFYIEDTK